MDWHDLAYFVALVEHGTLSACAEALDVQHSTVARRIERLEAALSVTLFDRLGKRYTLTQEGSLLYQQAREVKNEVITFERMAIDHNALQGTVIVSAPPVFANEMLMDALPDFRARYPDIVLQLQGDVHFSNLHHKEADIALRLSRPTEADLLIRTVSSVTYGFFAHQEYVAQRAPEEWQLIEFGANQYLREWLAQLTQITDYPIAFKSNDFYVTYSSVCRGVGIALLPDFLTRQQPELIAIDPIRRTALPMRQTNNEIKKSPASCPTDSAALDTDAFALTHTQDLYLVMHPDVQRSQRVRVVADWLISVLGRVFNSNVYD